MSNLKCWQKRELPKPKNKAKHKKQNALTPRQKINRHQAIIHSHQ